MQSKDMDFVLKHITQFPHCDQRVLHQPGECEYCDARPEWQALRVAWGIDFTGSHSSESVLPCPSERFRDAETINLWEGNRPKKMKAEKTFVPLVSQAYKEAMKEYWGREVDQRAIEGFRFMVAAKLKTFLPSWYLINLQVEIKHRFGSFHITLSGNQYIDDLERLLEEENLEVK